MSKLMYKIYVIWNLKFLFKSYLIGLYFILIPYVVVKIIFWKHLLQVSKLIFRLRVLYIILIIYLKTRVMCVIGVYKFYNFYLVTESFEYLFRLDAASYINISFNWSKYKNFYIKSCPNFDCSVFVSYWFWTFLLYLAQEWCWFNSLLSSK